MMINERLGKSEHHVKHLNATNHHLDDFAVKGLRTLNYAYKDISNKEYDEWKKEHKIAETAIIEREVCFIKYTPFMRVWALKLYTTSILFFFRKKLTKWLPS